MKDNKDLFIEIKNKIYNFVRTRNNDLNFYRDKKTKKEKTVGPKKKLNNY